MLTERNEKKSEFQAKAQINYLKRKVKHLKAELHLPLKHSKNAPIIYIGPTSPTANRNEHTS